MIKVSSLSLYIPHRSCKALYTHQFQLGCDPNVFLIFWFDTQSNRYAIFNKYWLRVSSFFEYFHFDTLGFFINTDCGYLAFEIFFVCFMNQESIS